MAKSDSYQYKLLEIYGIDQNIFNNYSTDHALSNRFQSVDPVFEQLRVELLEEVKLLIKTKLTKHQRIIIEMMFNGDTQYDIANRLGISQPAVHKAIHGNIDYTNGRRRYGGLVTKIKKIAAAHPKIIYLLSEIDRYKEDSENFIRSTFVAPTKPVVKEKRTVRVAPKRYPRDEYNKTCPHCLRFLPYNSFYRDKSKPNGRAVYCKSCETEIKTKRRNKK